MVLEFGNEFSVASPASLAQRVDDQIRDRGEGIRAFDAQDGTTSVFPYSRLGGFSEPEW